MFSPSRYFAHTPSMIPPVAVISSSSSSSPMSPSPPPTATSGVADHQDAGSTDSSITGSSSSGDNAAAAAATTSLAVDLECGQGVVDGAFIRDNNDNNNEDNEDAIGDERPILHTTGPVVINPLEQRVAYDNESPGPSSGGAATYQQQHQQQQQEVILQQQEKEQDHYDHAHIHPALPCASINFTYKSTKAPKETLQAIYKAGQYKAGLPLNILVVQSFMAGVYIAMAGHLYLAVGGGILGSAMFPTGLIAVVLTSAELFTGDALVFIASTLGGQVGVDKLLRNWTVAWLGNFAGSIFWASLVAYASDSLQDLHQVDLAIAVAQKKALQPWSHIFLKAMGANFMVCLGVWQATCAEEVAGKILAIWFPIAGFCMMGFEHVIANQFLIPIGMMYGGDDQVVSVASLFSALSAGTLGNIVGGGILVGAVYWYIFDAMAATQTNAQLHRLAATVAAAKLPLLPHHHQHHQQQHHEHDHPTAPAPSSQ
ncbi:hypothetical protein ACA910_015613 [Epithemia clementina (nom. ined.)]